MKSPLRYPGGKAKLADYLEQVIVVNSLEGCTYLEPYAGGCGLALELLERGLVSNITLNDADPIIYAFWNSILTRSEDICELIEQTPVTVDEWKVQKAKIESLEDYNELELGFAAFFLNRTNRSGIIKGAGIIGGYEQNGNWKIDARYYRETMISRVKAIAKQRSKIKFFNKDAVDFCKQHSRKNNTLVYLDPPYFAKGQRLYRNFYKPSDHKKISEFVQNSLNGNWIVSYDNAPEILDLYSKSNSFLYGLPYTSTKRRTGTEAIFFSKGLEVPLPCPPMIAVA